jgi:hypothetical protein
MSLVLEPLMFWLLHAVLKAHDQLQYFGVATVTLYAFITAMNFVKIFTHFKKHPTDLVYFPRLRHLRLLVYAGQDMGIDNMVERLLSDCKGSYFIS